VLTGGGGITDVVREVLSSYIFPAVKSDEPLPANSDSVALLEQLTLSLSTPPPAEPKNVPPLPEIAHMISGKTYYLDYNQFGILSITLTFNEQEKALLNLTSTGVMTLGDTEWKFLIGMDNVERFSPGTFDIPNAGKGSWVTDNYFSAQIDMTGSSHMWQIGMHFEGDEVIVRIDDLSESVREFPKFVGQLREGKGIVTPETEHNVTVTNPSKGTSPDKPGWWVITVREGPSSDYDLVRFLEPGETAVAVGRDEPGDWLLLDDGGWVAVSAVVVEGDIEALPLVSSSSNTG
jgi:hypothetical protein